MTKKERLKKLEDFVKTIPLEEYRAINAKEHHRVNDLETRIIDLAQKVNTDIPNHAQAISGLIDRLNALADVDGLVKKVCKLERLVREGAELICMLQGEIDKLNHRSKRKRATSR